MLRHDKALATLLLGLGIWLPSAAKAQERYGLGSEATPGQIAGWNIDVRPDGTGLPDGHGTVSEGKKVYETRCAACHGEKGDGPMDKLVGGRGTLATAKPVKTVGSYWPYATTLFDYIHRAMPFNEPQTLTASEVYAVAAYVLNMNGIVPHDAVLDARTLPQVMMPDRDGFIGPDPRPDVTNIRCMVKCEALLPEKAPDQPLTPDQVQ
jgi:mono/diheme cytochrome c family protein